MIASLLACQPRACSDTSSQDHHQYQFPDKIKKDLEYFTNLPHAFGSFRQYQVAEYIAKRGEEQGFEVKSQNFKSITPNPELKGPGVLKLEKSGQNILWLTKDKAEKPVVLIGSHYDTKNLQDLAYVGANDSASSSTAVMNFLNYLNQQEPNCHFVGVWFDGEESVLHNWNDGDSSYPIKIKDNTYGSRYFVSQLKKCDKEWCLPDTNKKIIALILLDMIGSKNPKITLDTFSNSELSELMLKSISELGYQKILGNKIPIEDDHTSFLQVGIPSIDIIDFENTNVWHSHGDSLENLSIGSMLMFSKIAIKTAIKTCAYNH